MGAVFGGWLTTWYRGRIEREEAWRTRRIEAADEFATAQNQSLNSGATAINRLNGRPNSAIRQTNGEFTEWANEVTDDFNAGRKSAVSAIGRIELLFGVDSPTANSAWDSTTALREAVYIAALGPRSLEQHGIDADDKDAIRTGTDEELDRAVNSYSDFIRAATSEITGEVSTGRRVFIFRRSP